MRELRLPLLVATALFLLVGGGCVNRPPMLNCIVEPQTVTEGQTATIRSNANDPNNDPLTFEWSSSSGRVSGQSAATFDSTGLSPGRYTVTANVRDEKNTVTCSVDVNVEKNKQPPTVSCNPSNVSVTEGQSTTLSASASDPNNDSLTYSWSVDGQSVTNDSASFEFGTQGRSVGSHAAAVTVMDVDGLSANCAFSVSVDRRPNRNPTVTVTLEKNEVYAGDTLPASAQGSDPDNDPLTYSWTLDGQNYSGTSNSIQINTSGLAGGRHSVSATVRDDRGATDNDTKQFSVREKIVIQMNTARPNNVAKARLDEIALKMQQNPQLRASITGHTDDRGSEGGNQRYGQRRADALKDYLVSEHSVSEGRIEAKSAGESQPVSDNNTPQGRQDNRRAEVELYVQ